MAEVRIKKLKDAELIINRLLRKSQKVVVGLAPASVIYQYAERPKDDGSIFRILFPTDGKIVRIFIHIPIASKEKPVPLHFEVISRRGQYMDVTAMRPEMKVELGYEVFAGDRIIVITDPAVSTSFEISALFQPKLDMGEMHKTKIDALEAIANEGILTSE